jgi:hypothetical protein
MDEWLGKQGQMEGFYITLKPRERVDETHHKKRAGGVTQSVGPEFKPQYYKKEVHFYSLDATCP